MVKRRHLVIAVSLATGLVGQAAAQVGGSATMTPTNDLPNPYQTITGWAKLPEGRTWGSTSAVDIDKDGVSIWVAERCQQNSCTGSDLPAILKFDANGNLVKSFGAGILNFPHGIHVDRDGNIWVTDGRDNRVGRGRGAAADAPLPPQPAVIYGHQIFKFSPDGQLLMTLGTKGGGRDSLFFWQPNDVLVTPNGDIFVAEGHASNATANARILKFDRTGKLIKTFGSYGYGASQFRGPHSLAMDSKGRLFVADRGNRRIQIFDQDGKHLDTWYQFSRISGIHIDANDTLYAIDSESDDNYNPGWRKGLRVGSARTGEVWYFVPEHVSKQASGMGGYGSMGEGVTVDGQGIVYAGEVGPIQGLTKFVPRLKR